MHCNRCRSVMGSTHREEAPRSLLEWYDCPVCGLRELVATPTRASSPVPRWAVRASPARAGTRAG